MATAKTYSREELEEFRQVIHARLHEANDQLELIQDQLDGVNNYTEHLNASYGDDSRRDQQRSFLNERLVRQKRQVHDLERALIRIENGSYGVCTDTGELIARKRLLAMPAATLSLKAKERAGA